MKRFKRWLLAGWLLLLAIALLCSFGVIPDRTPGLLQYAAILLGIVSAVRNLRAE